MNRTQANEELLELADLKQQHSQQQQHVQRLVQLQCRHNFLSFCKFVTNGAFKPFAVHKKICDLLDKVARGEERKVVISAPPRHGKSFLTAQLFPAYILGRNPHSQNIIASYGKSLSREHALKTLDILNSPRYKLVFPEVELKSKEIAEIIRLKSGGVSRITSAGANCTGFGFGTLDSEDFPGIALADDLLADGNSQAIMNSTWEWTAQQFLTRKLPNHAVILIGTRFHKSDITGRILEAEPGEWTTLNIPALCSDESTDPLGRKLGESAWPEYFPAEQLESTQRQIGERAWNALYQGNPVSDSTKLFRRELFNYYSQLPLFRYYYITADTAFSTKESADESALMVWGVSLDNKLWLLDCQHGRWDFNQLLQQTQMLANQWKVNEIAIEAKASGQSLIQVLAKELPNIKITPLKADKDKQTRAAAVTSLVSHVWVPGQRSWLAAILEQLEDFPLAAHDDLVDCFVHGVQHWATTWYSPAVTGESFKIRSLGNLRASW